MDNITKVIHINYDDIETLLERKDSMITTVNNFINRTESYKFIRDEIVLSENDKCTLNIYLEYNHGSN